MVTCENRTVILRSRPSGGNVTADTPGPRREGGRTCKQRGESNARGQPTYGRQSRTLQAVTDALSSPSKRCIAGASLDQLQRQCKVLLCRRGAEAPSHSWDEARATVPERSASTWIARTCGTSMRLEGERRHARVGLPRRDDIGTTSLFIECKKGVEGTRATRRGQRRGGQL